jgi:anti-sigma factor RsiW
MHIHATTLDRYLDGSLDDQMRAAVDAHVATCVACTETLASAGGRDIVWVRRGPLRRLVRVRMN